MNLWLIYFAVEFVVDCMVDHCLNAGPLAHLMNIKLASVIKRLDKTFAVCMRNNIIAWQSEFSYSLYQRQSFPKRILHTRTYKYTHDPLLPLCAPHAIWPSGCSGVVTQDPRGSHSRQKTSAGRERQAGREPLKHTHTYTINNTSAYSEWLSLNTVQYVQYRGLPKYFDI